MQFATMIFFAEEKERFADVEVDRLGPAEEKAEVQWLPCSLHWARGWEGSKNAFFGNGFFENAFFENFANFWRARSRLYQNEILQENMRSTAFFKLYKICLLLHRCNLKNSVKNRFEKSAIFVKFQQKKLQMSQTLQNFVKFQKFQLENLVDFEKCCKTHIFLQKSEPIQPKTSNNLPEFCQLSGPGGPPRRPS